MASADGPWVRFFPSDWLAGTRGMSATETGVYITLVALMYERSEPIARDDARLARLCGLRTSAFTTVLDTLIEQGKVTLVGAKLWGRKVEVEVQNRALKSNAGRKGAQAKHEQYQRPDPATAERPHNDRSAIRAGATTTTTVTEDTSLRSVAPSAPKATRGTRLSNDWVLPQPYGEWALEKGLSRDRIMVEADKMRNWSINAGKLGVKVDWFAAWKNWVQKALDDGVKGAPRVSARDRRQADMEAYEANLKLEIANAGYGSGQGFADPDEQAVGELPLVAAAYRRLR